MVMSTRLKLTMSGFPRPLRPVLHRIRRHARHCDPTMVMDDDSCAPDAFPGSATPCSQRDLALRYFYVLSYDFHRFAGHGTFRRGEEVCGSARSEPILCAFDSYFQQGEPRIARSVG